MCRGTFTRLSGLPARCVNNTLLSAQRNSLVLVYLSCKLVTRWGHYLARSLLRGQHNIANISTLLRITIMRFKQLDRARVAGEAPSVDSVDCIPYVTH